MTVNTKNLVSITEANQNFSRVARLVDENGAAVILKNNVPRYVLVEFSQAEQEQLAEDEDRERRPHLPSDGYWGGASGRTYHLS